jgi:hypothetical protein
VFIGHFGIALGAKRVVPGVRLGTLLLAAQFLDLLWPVFLLLGVEEVKIVPGITALSPFDFTRYPISHSLLTVIGWSAGFGLVYYIWHRSRRGALVTGFLVLSHWALDWIVHRPDLPLAPSSPTRVGLGLWNSVSGTVIVEGSIFLIGAVLYARTTRARDRIGNWALWALILFLGVLYVANLTGPPPSDTRLIGWVSLATWLLIPWAYWIDRHRRALGESSR